MYDGHKGRSMQQETVIFNSNTLRASIVQCTTLYTKLYTAHIAWMAYTNRNISKPISPSSSTPSCILNKDIHDIQEKNSSFWSVLKKKSNKSDKDTYYCQSYKLKFGKYGMYNKAYFCIFGEEFMIWQEERRQQKDLWPFYFHISYLYTLGPSFTRSI